MNSGKDVLSVTQVNLMARTLLQQITVWVLGEVDDYQDTYKSATYFKLKDGESLLPCMFWKSEDVSYFPKNGEKVLIFGTLSLWEKTGQFRMMVAKIEPFGEGELLKRREELRKKLQAEGYFAQDLKRAIPELPLKIGLITSKRGAAIEDFRTNVVKGFPGLEIYFVDALVQGDAAVKSICDAFKRLSRESLDLVVLTRGGGDIEDLMCFNTEEIVKAIRACPHPVISAVGHEIDYTLSDLAADLRVSTPTKAAEYISSLYIAFANDLEAEYQTLESKFDRLLQNYLYELDMIEAAIKRTWANFKTLPEQLSDVYKRLGSGLLKQLSFREISLSSLHEKIEALSPTNVLKRGYSISYLSDGTILKSVAQVKMNDKLMIRLSNGSVDTLVTDKTK